MKNPFPGMNPWLEEYWRDVHARLLVHASEQLNDRLPDELRARVDERLVIDIDEEKPQTYVPDVAITESWDRASRPVIGQRGLPVNVAEPVVVDLGHQIVRRLEIVDSREHIITAIEVASPSNKAVGEAWEAWRRKRNDYVATGINVVEVDLLRGGGWILPDRSLLKPIPTGRVWHHVCITRAPWKGEHEFYVLPLRERLPTIRIPLRRADPDVALDLQSLIDQCYTGGRYGSTIDYTKAPNPALPEEEAIWAKEVLAMQQKI
jgi:hypothetical protein